MMVTPLTSSPARIARWIGAAPRHRGSSEAWTLMQPAPGASRIGCGQDQAVSGDHRQIGIERGEARLFVGVAQGSRSANFDAERFGAVMDGGPALALAAAGRARRLAIDRDDVMARVDQRVEARHREVRRSHEDDPHRVLVHLRGSPSAVKKRRYGQP